MTCKRCGNTRDLRFYRNYYNDEDLAYWTQCQCPPRRTVEGKRKGVKKNKPSPKLDYDMLEKLAKELTCNGSPDCFNDVSTLRRMDVQLMKL